MQGAQDHYSILGVPPTASSQDIRSAYRKQVRLCHPDVSREPHAVERFRVVCEAYRVLGDPASRAAYDAQLDPPKVAPQARNGESDRQHRVAEARASFPKLAHLSDADLLKAAEDAELAQVLSAWLAANPERRTLGFSDLAGAWAEQERKNYVIPLSLENLVYLNRHPDQAAMFMRAQYWLEQFEFVNWTAKDMLKFWRKKLAGAQFFLWVSGMALATITVLGVVTFLTAVPTHSYFGFGPLESRWGAFLRSNWGPPILMLFTVGLVALVVTSIIVADLEGRIHPLDRKSPADRRRGTER